MSVNKSIILGRLGGDPELKYTPGGTAVCTFQIATSEKWTDKAGEKQEKTNWHKIVAWGKLAELSNQYLKKGSMAYVEGRMETRSWEDNKGVTRYITEVNAIVVEFINMENSNGKKKDEYGF